MAISISLKPCPVCGKEDWKNPKHMVDHINQHNTQDPEYDKSVKKEQERKKREPFTG